MGRGEDRAARIGGRVDDDGRRVVVDEVLLAFLRAGIQHVLLCQIACLAPAEGHKELLGVIYDDLFRHAVVAHVSVSARAVTTQASS